MEKTKKDISDRVNVNNIVELFKTTASLSKDSYDNATRYDVGKDFISGDFPVLITKEGETLYVAFRGTRNDFSTFTSSLESVRNMIIDATSGDTLGENTKLSEFHIFDDCLPNFASELSGHKGFITELSQYYNTIKNEITIFYGQVNNLVITGHSAGGALATLFYYIYRNDFKIKYKIPIGNVITYGSPRVIRNTFENINLYNNSCKDLIRCFNANDIVSYVPLKNPTIFGGSLISGFVHVGYPFPLDTNVENNSLNALILQVLRGNKDKFNEIFTKYSLDQLRENDIIGLITSDKYLSIISESIFKCYTKVGVKESVSDEMLVSYTGRLLTDSEKILDYATKCNLATPLGIADILKENNIYDSEIQQDIGISGIIGSLMGYNKISVSAHNLDTYIENIEKLEARELKTGKSILDPINNTTQYPLPTTPVPITTRNIYNSLVQKILDDIDSGQLIGAVEVDTTDLPAIVLVG